MRPVETGVQWTSRVSYRVRFVAMVVAVALSLPVVAGPANVAVATDYLLMPRSELLTRPVSGSAWTNLRSIADESLGSARPTAATLIIKALATSGHPTVAIEGLYVVNPS